MTSPLIAAGWPSDPAARRGIAARMIVAEDARWIQDVVHSANAAADDGAMASAVLMLGHHFVRIAYEGSIALRSANLVGEPALAKLLTDEFQTITERARHMSKLLDDTKKSEDEVLDEIGDALAQNRRIFLDGVHPLVRSLAKDLGIYRIDGRIVGATVPMSYRLGLDASSPQTMFAEATSAVTREWGTTLATLGAADLEQSTQTSTLALDSSTISDQDVRSSKYLAQRYDAVLDEREKLLLLMIEGDLNCNELYLPLTSAGHEQPVFRARVVSLYHSLRAVSSIVEPCTSIAARRVQQILDDGPTQKVLSPSGKQVRNRCVHYEIRDARITINPGRPFYGIVEDVFPGETFESFDRTVNDVTTRLAEALGDWST
jgi:hypothetical protein